MTEQTVPPHDSQAFDSQARSAAAAAGAGLGESETAAQAPPDWETVEFPGTQPLAALGAPDFSQREADLLQLIQDLNQCNDALLVRVSVLEEALERSEAALQIEVERSHQHQSMTSAEAQAAISQQQHQVAQLLSELDVASDGLRRTTIHAETLQVELDANKQRVAQLERECTLLQQRFSEKSTALLQAEATSRDLRSRLHRQQHYTLQFKAALEKCLDVSAHRSASETAAAPYLADMTLRPHPLAMPKAQQIQPWSLDEAGAARANPSLDTLLRNLKSVGQGPSAPAPTAAPSPAADLDPEAENQLWQDLERVIETSSAKPAAPPAAASQSEAAFTEPSPWGVPLPAPAAPAAPPEPASLAAELAPEVLPEPAPEIPLAAPAPVRPQRPAAPMPAFELPPTLTGGGLTETAATSPSPVVYPLRPQKKLKSIAAVQLPSFPRPQRSQ